MSFIVHAEQHILTIRPVILIVEQDDNGDAQTKIEAFIKTPEQHQDVQVRFAPKEFETNQQSYVLPRNFGATITTRMDLFGLGGAHTVVLNLPGRLSVVMCEDVAYLHVNTVDDFQSCPVFSHHHNRPTISSNLLGALRSTGNPLETVLKYISEYQNERTLKNLARIEAAVTEDNVEMIELLATSQLPAGSALLKELLARN